MDLAHLGDGLLYTCLCCACAGVNPRVKSGRFMKLLPDYEHMDYRDVYTHCMYMGIEVDGCSMRAFVCVCVGGRDMLFQFKDTAVAALCILF